jgi:hypothetical protein
MCKQFARWLATRLLNAGGLLLVLTACAGTALARDTTPEIDPASATSALTLLIGGLLMITGRRRSG